MLLDVNDFTVEGLYCNVHSPSLLTIHSRLFTITNDFLDVTAMFLFWPGTSKGRTPAVFFLHVLLRSGTSMGGRQETMTCCTSCAKSLCSSHPTAQFYSPTSPRAQQFLEQFQVITFWLFNFRRNMRPKGNCWSCLGNFDIHRAQVPRPNSSFFEKPRGNKLRQCSTIAGTDGKCSMAASSLRKAFSMILNGCIIIIICTDLKWRHFHHFSSPSIWGRSNLPCDRQVGATHLGPPLIPTNTLSRTTRGMASLVSRNRVASPERQQRDWQRQKNDFTLDEEYMCEAPSFVGMLTYVTIEYIGILYIYVVKCIIYIYILFI